MVRIIVRGQSQSISKEEAKEAFSFFSDYLLGRRLSKNIRISVTFLPVLFENDQIMVICIEQMWLRDVQENLWLKSTRK